MTPGMALESTQQNVVGLGFDLVSVEAIRLALTRDADVAAAWLTIREIETLGARAFSPEVLAGRIAGKEAVVKALGCGFSGDITWQDVEIVAAADGIPLVILSTAAATFASSKRVREVLVSISHLDTIAAATAVTLR